MHVQSIGAGTRPPLLTLTGYMTGMKQDYDLIMILIFVYWSQPFTLQLQKITSKRNVHRTVILPDWLR